MNDTEIKKGKPGTYRDPEDGLFHCVQCGKPVQIRLDSECLGGKRVMPCVCDCEKKRMEKEAEQGREIDAYMKTRRLIEIGSVPYLYRFNTFSNDRFSDSEQSQAAHVYVDKWDDMKAQGIGMIFHGAPSMGKTFTACCIANALLEKGVFVYITSVADITNSMQTQEEMKRRRNFTRAAELMVIDDLGAERNTEYAKEQLFSVVDQRITTKKPLIVTTNLSLSEMAHAGTMANKRIYERVLGMCQIRIEFKRENLRAAGL